VEALVANPLLNGEVIRLDGASGCHRGDAASPPACWC
jgi:hypothetical protein